MELNPEQQAALKILKSGQNVFLTGKAGVGKSTLLRQFLAKTKKNCIVCAPTGIAALNVGGVTLHRCFGISTTPKGPDDPKQEDIRPSKALQQADVIIIDEISMCRFDLFSYVCRYLMSLKKKVQIILVGDFFQLPPVITETDAAALKSLWHVEEIGEGFAFMSHYWQQLKLKVINLQQVMRQSDTDFIEILNAIRSGNDKDTDIIAWLRKNSEKNKAENHALYTTAVRVVPYRKVADNINKKRLSEIEEDEHTYEGRLNGDFVVGDAPAEQTLSLKTGARIMTLVNDPEGRFVNGSTGFVTNFDDKGGTVTVRFDDGKLAEISRYEWKKIRYKIDPFGRLVPEVTGTFNQFPLRLAYAVTIHKSQGQTFSAIVVTPGMFANGQLYVALSRCKSRDGFFIDGTMKTGDWKVSGAVYDFYKEIEKNSGPETSQADSISNPRSSQPKAAPEPVILNISFQQNQLVFLRRYAEEDGQTAEAFVRRVVLDYMRSRFQMDKISALNILHTP